MSVTPVGIVARATYNSSTKTSTLAAQFTQDVPAGHTLGVAVTVEGVGGIAAVGVVTDARGNAYTAGPSNTDGSLRQVLQFEAGIQTRIVSGDSLTVSIKDGSGTPLPRNRWNVLVFDISGIAASPIDATAVGNGSGLNMHVGPTGTPSQAEGILIGAYDIGPGQTFSAGPDGSVAGVSTTAGVGTSNDHQLGMSYQLIPAGGTPAPLTTEDSQSSTSNWTGTAMFLKAASVQALSVTAVTPTGTWLLTPSSGKTAVQIVSDNDTTTYLQSPDNPVGSSAYETFALSTPSPIPGSTDTVSFAVYVDAPGASTSSIDMTLYRGGSTIVHAFTGLAVPAGGGWVTVTLTSADVAAITAASAWNALTLRVAATAAP